MIIFFWSHTCLPFSMPLLKIGAQVLLLVNLVEVNHGVGALRISEGIPQ